jgi:S-DNA-T family DNA segregation ATPase FtsK/SpoIIIE
VLVDDCECLDGTSIENALVEVTRLVEQAGGLVAAALDTRRSATAFRGLVPELSRSGTGIVLCPSSATDGDLLRTRVEPQSVRTPGRGLLVTDGLATPTQVATPPLTDSGSGDTTGSRPLDLVTSAREEMMGAMEGR